MIFSAIYFIAITIEILSDKAFSLLKKLEQLKLRLPKKNESAKSVISNIGNDIDKGPLKNLEADIFKPLRKDLTLQELLTEQQFKGFDRVKLDKLAKEINIQEPIEEILAMLRP
ncbi:MAG: hypothetical protein MUC59_09505 [Saprospiraceae bacterium]|nr:hypothetical protein [Saprospiraceae bacterium]